MFELGHVVIQDTSTGQEGDQALLESNTHQEVDTFESVSACIVTA